MAGEGLRNQINVEDDFLGVFDSFLKFKLGRLEVPTGLLLFFFLFCFGMWLFQRSRFGMMMGAAGQNPNFARAAGINVDKMRVIGTAISTALGAVGIICYAQCYGYLQLYNAPQMMGFSCVASVLIGGGLSNEGEYLLEPVREIVANTLYGKGTMTPPKILKASLGNLAGVIGAAFLETQGDK